MSGANHGDLFDRADRVRSEGRPLADLSDSQPAELSDLQPALTRWPSARQRSKVAILLDCRAFQEPRAGQRLVDGIYLATRLLTSAVAAGVSSLIGGERTVIWLGDHVTSSRARPLHAHPEGVRQAKSRSIHVSPQALPVVQTLQQLGDGGADARRREKSTTTAPLNLTMRSND